MIEHRVSLKDGVLMPLSSELVYHGMNSCVARGTQCNKVVDGVVRGSGFLSKAVYVMNDIRRMFPAFMTSVLITLQDNISRASHPVIAVRGLCPRFNLVRIVSAIRSGGFLALYILARFAGLLNSVTKDERGSTLFACLHGANGHNSTGKTQGFKALSIPDLVSDGLARLAKLLCCRRLGEFSGTVQATRLSVVFHFESPSQCISQYTTLGGRNVQFC